MVLGCREAPSHGSWGEEAQFEAQDSRSWLGGRQACDKARAIWFPSSWNLTRAVVVGVRATARGALAGPTVIVLGLSAVGLGLGLGLVGAGSAERPSTRH